MGGGAKVMAMLGSLDGGGAVKASLAEMEEAPEAGGAKSLAASAGWVV